ncbi:MAG TPA: hypothetical protein VKZ18_13845 [Polyangia bacterium]|nr:hypothetical protein [Polyangia bacterium]
MERDALAPLVADWIRYHAERRKGTDPLFEAWEKVTDIVMSDPEEGWTVVLALVDASPDDWVLCNVAAGPLEDLLRKFSDVLVDRAEVQARRDPKFRRCLTGVWGLPPPVQARLRKYTSTIKDPL